MEPNVALVVVVLALAVVGFVVLRRRASSTVPTGAPSSEGGSPVGSDGLGAKVRSLFRGGSDEDTWAELEGVLLRADVGPLAADELVAYVRERTSPDSDPVALLSRRITELLGDPGTFELAPERLSVVLVVGVNGSGKTTTIGKLAARLTADGRSVSLAASDTFRAAAGEQLDTWAGRAGAHIVAQERGADPGAVAFDAVTSAIARGSDVLLVDTAGRLHTKTPLMEELKKVARVIDKAGGTIDHTLLIIDAQTGQNGIAQARAFTEAVEVTGIVLTKMDGSAKGGIVIAITRELGVPVRFVGTGEQAEDLAPFEVGAFVDALLGS